MLFDIENNDLFENIKENNKTYSNYNNTVKNALNSEKTVHTCLHCGNDTPLYCEKCYQELISKNTELQLEIEKLKKKHKIICGLNVELLENIEYFIPKQVIRDKLEELKKNTSKAQGEELLIFDSKLDILEELLEE